MMMSEFIERVGFEPTAAEYQEIEREYMGCDVDKDQFCKEWKKEWRHPAVNEIESQTN